MKTIKKCSHLKEVSSHLLSKSKRKPAKEVDLSKIVGGKIRDCSFDKNLIVNFIVKFFRIFQRTEVVVVNVKHKFHLESRLGDVFTKNKRQF